MPEHQVTCINKPDHYSPHEHIMFVGNLEGKWRLSSESTIYQIENKVNQFYTIDPTTGGKCYIGVVKETGKNPYLKTHADGKWNDNLLAQANCDESCRIV
jgi:hypothetical protein